MLLLIMPGQEVQKMIPVIAAQEVRAASDMVANASVRVTVRGDRQSVFAHKRLDAEKRVDTPGFHCT